MSSHYTAGPWFVRELPSAFQVCTWSPAMSVVDLPKFESMSDTDLTELRATAQLIAAAPEMIERIAELEGQVAKLREVLRGIESIESEYRVPVDAQDNKAQAIRLACREARIALAETAPSAEKDGGL